MGKLRYSSTLSPEWIIPVEQELNRAVSPSNSAAGLTRTTSRSSCREHLTEDREAPKSGRRLRTKKSKQRYSSVLPAALTGADSNSASASGIWKTEDGQPGSSAPQILALNPQPPGDHTNTAPQSYSEVPKAPIDNKSYFADSDFASSLDKPNLLRRDEPPPPTIGSPSQFSQSTNSPYHGRNLPSMAPPMSPAYSEM